MFEQVRKPSRTQSITIWILFGAIITVFIFFGVVPDRMGSDPTGVAAVVNRKHISLADFRDRVNNIERQYQERIEQVPAAQRQDLSRDIRRRALEDLIQFEAMVQAASERGVVVADEEIRDAIVNLQAFQEEGRFKRDYYDRFLKERQWTPRQFEERIRKDIVMRKIQGLFQEALKPAAIEQAKDNEAENTKLQLEVASFSDDELKAKVPVSSAEIKAWLSNKDNAAKVKKTYEENLAQYAEPEQVKARHILVRVDKSQSGSEAAAKAKIEKLREQALKGDFAQLAKQNTEDTASKETGGDLGYFSKGRMVPEFEAAAFTTAKGEVSPIVKTDFGYHILKVEDKKAARQKEFAEVQDELVKIQVAQDKLGQVGKKLEEAVAQGNESSLRQQLKELKFDLTDLGSHSLATTEIPGLGDTDRLFELVVQKKIKKGVVPEMIKSGGVNHIVIVKDLKTEKSADGMLDGYVSSRKFIDAFSGWAKTAIESADIQRNSQVILQ